MKMDVKPTMDSRSVNQYILSLIEDKLIGCASIILVGPGKYSADYLINEIFINKSNPIDNTLLNNNRVKTDTNNRKNTAKTSRSLEKSNDDKQVKIFEFPFSSFLSS